jgi:hypothetical protein
VALVTSIAKSRIEWLLWLAFGFLGLMIAVGIWYGRKPAYRHLHDREIKKLRCALQKTPPPEARYTFYKPEKPVPIEDRLPCEDWYRAMIDLERKIYGDGQTGNRCHWWQRGPLAPVKTLQEGFDLERRGVYIVQLLSLVVLGLLVASVVLAS